MKGYFVSHRLQVLALAVITAASCLFSTAQSQVQAAPPQKKDIDPKEPKDPPQPQPPEPGSFSGYTNGKVAIVLRQDNKVPAPKGNATTYKQVGDVIDLKTILAKLWNDNRTDVENQIKTMLKDPVDGHKLYGAKITLGTANANNKLW